MTLTYVDIQGFRSIRRIRLPLRRLTVLLGTNGVGKTNLYRSLELLQAAATGGLAAEIAREGGLQSIFFAGGKNLSPDGSFDPMYRSDGLRKGEANRLTLEAHLEDLSDDSDALALRYRIELGFPIRGASAAFALEAQVKAETLTLLDGTREVAAMERKGPAVFARDAAGKRQEHADTLLSTETALASIGNAPAVEAVRLALRNWRFYHGFRTDPDSPLRRPAPAVTAPMLSSDGSNLGRRLRHAALHPRRNRRSRSSDRRSIPRCAAGGASAQRLCDVCGGLPRDPEARLLGPRIVRRHAAVP